MLKNALPHTLLEGPATYVPMISCIHMSLCH